MFQLDLLVQDLIVFYKRNIDFNVFNILSNFFKNMKYVERDFFKDVD